MSSSRPSGTAQTIVNNEPWEEQRPFLTRGFERAGGLLDRPVQFFPNSTVVPFNPATQEALGGIASRARAGSPVLQAGQTAIGQAAGGQFLGTGPGMGGFSQFGAGTTVPQTELARTATGEFRGASPSAAGYGEFAAGTTTPQTQMARTAAGDFLGSNTALQNIIAQATGRAGSAIDARFSGAGRYGSGQHARNVVDSTADITARILGPAYESERARQEAAASNLATTRMGGLAGQQAIQDAQRSRELAAAGSLAQTQLSGLTGGQQAFGTQRADQLQAAGIAPQMAQADYTDLSRLGEVGGAFEQQGRAQLQDRISRFMQEQTAPRDALREYMATIGGGTYGGQTTTQQPIYSDPWSQGLGTAATLAGVGGSLFGSGGMFPGFRMPT